MANKDRGEPVPQTFADFLYAVVIGVAFSDLNLAQANQLLCAQVFILLCVLEDFCLYQTQIKPRTNLYKFASFRSIFFELAILLSWFAAFKLSTSSTKASLIALAAFFFFKLSATLIRLPWANGPSRSFFQRDFTFALPVAGFTLLALLGPSWNLQEGTIWLYAAFIWIAQTLFWWSSAAAEGSTA
jgi:hypothetical protein